MDLKTLEYMEERVNKAREIVKTIEKLKAHIEFLNGDITVKFIDQRTASFFDSKFCDFTWDLKAAYVEIANFKIKELETKLAEL